MNKIARIKIIAGSLRGRFVEFPNIAAIRPTPQRVRETLFNWLMHDISNAVCLDAFAGSGALSFEAYSRGAKQIWLIEQNPSLARSFAENMKRLSINNVQCITANFLQHTFPKQYFNIVFLDPPFQQNLLIPALQHIIAEDLLMAEHRIYFEVEKNFDVATLLPYAEIVKNQLAGQVRYGLLRAHLQGKK